ncbi:MULTISPECIES: hypothetical protein [Halomonadaceae]|uniref:hypothetical protein n=1 Tax=Halomonadaceae TaxID=28256 RepID=UPI00159812B7|nr:MULTISPECIES: hypothetical protein [Halomonas]QJQ95794.1 hypothetical protein HIO72_11285 [Halomonas sp. PA5]
MKAKATPSATASVLIVFATLGLGALGVAVSELRLPLDGHDLAMLSIMALALGMLMGLLLLVATLMAGLGAQHQALARSIATQSRQLQAAETAQLMERFVHQAEALLDKESLDPNKRSVLRCLAVDALRGNTGRGDPNISRLGRLFEWLANEAEAAQADTTRMRLIDPVLRQYAEIAEQLCQVGESDAERLAVFLRYQPMRVTTKEEAR